MGAITTVRGVTRLSSAPETDGYLAGRLGFRHILRAVVRDRSAVRLDLVDGSALDGTLDRVGADFVELAEHPAGELRRRSQVRGIVVVPLVAIAIVRRDSGGQSGE
jgi:hypothetical protein